VSITVGVRFTAEQLDLIDQLRGEISRAEFVRSHFVAWIEEYQDDVAWPEHQFYSNVDRGQFEGRGGLPWIDYKNRKSDPQ